MCSLQLLNQRCESMQIQIIKGKQNGENVASGATSHRYEALSRTAWICGSVPRLAHDCLRRNKPIAMGQQDYAPFG